MAYSVLHHQKISGAVESVLISPPSKIPPCIAFSVRQSVATDTENHIAKSPNPREFTRSCDLFATPCQM